MSSTAHQNIAWKGRVKLSHSVVLTILDHHIRKDPKYSYVFGPLFGHFASGNYEVKSCCALPHPELKKDGEEDRTKIVIKREYDNILSMFAKSTHGDSLIGWFRTGAQSEEMMRFSTDMNSYFQSKFHVPILLCVDTSLRSASLLTSAFIIQPLRLNGVVIGSKFARLEMGYAADPIDVSTLNLISRATRVDDVVIMNDIHSLDVALKRLSEMLQETKRYVERVVRKEIEGDVEIGKSILDALNAIPRITQSAFKSSFQSAFQDLLLVLYLVQVTKAQVMVAEKLCSVPL